MFMTDCFKVMTFSVEIFFVYMIKKMLLFCFSHSQEFSVSPLTPTSFVLKHMPKSFSCCFYLRSFSLLDLIRRVQHPTTNNSVAVVDCCFQVIPSLNETSGVRGYSSMKTVLVIILRVSCLEKQQQQCNLPLWAKTNHLKNFERHPFK